MLARRQTSKNSLKIPILLSRMSMELLPAGELAAESNATSDGPSESVVTCQVQTAEELGAGTSGTVYSVTPALSFSDGLKKALKVVALGESGLPTPGQIAECQLHASLPPHESIVRYHHSWVQEKDLHLLLERVDGELWDALEGDNVESIDEEERSDWIESLLSAVACCHANGVAHRDISPWNSFLLKASSGRRRLKLGDFGLAVRVPPSGSPSGLGGLFGMNADGYAPLDESAIGSLYSAPGRSSIQSAACNLCMSV